MMRSFENLPVAEKRRPSLVFSTMLDGFAAATSHRTVEQVYIERLDILRRAV